jgi:hypothetical protein
MTSAELLVSSLLLNGALSASHLDLGTRSEVIFLMSCWCRRKYGKLPAGFVNYVRKIFSENNEPCALFPVPHAECGMRHANAPSELIFATRSLSTVASRRG